jgi:hypothetical protein
VAVEPLTDREWWLMCRVQRGTLRAVVEACDETGMPGKTVAAQMLKIALDDEDVILRRMVGALIEEYKPDA